MNIKKYISVQFSHSVVSDYLWLHGLQHARPPCPSPTPGVYPNLCPLSRWYHPTTSSSVVPVSSCLQSFPASGSSNESFLRIGWSKYWIFSFSIQWTPMNTQDWFPLGWTGWISLLSKGLSRIFSSTTIWNHQLFSTQPALWSNSHICGASQVALVGNNLPVNAVSVRDASSILGLGRSPGGGNDLLQYSYLENPMDRGAWRAT